MTSTKISQNSKSTAKKSTGSATFFQEDFTSALRADVKGNHRCCQENGPIPADFKTSSCLSLIKKVQMRDARRVRERGRTLTVRLSERTKRNEAGGPFSSGSQGSCCSRFNWLWSSSISRLRWIISRS